MAETQSDQPCQVVRQTAVKLKRDLSFTHTVSIITGIMIGAFIFVTPNLIAVRCGSVGLSLIVWAASGIFVLCQALTYTEIGLLYPSAGEACTYYTKVVGPIAGFLYAWFRLVVIGPVFGSMLAMVTAEYLLVPVFNGCQPPAMVTRLCAICIYALTAVVNSSYARYVARVQTGLTFIKFATLIMVIITGVVQICRGFEGTTRDAGDLATAIYLCMMTFQGWNYVFMVIEEIRSPSRVIPRAMVVSFLMVIGVYVCTNVAYFTVLSPNEMAQSTVILGAFSERVLGSIGRGVSVLVALSTLGSLNGVVLGGARILVVAARERLFPQSLSMIHVEYSTPLPVIWLTWLLSTVYTLTGSSEALTEYLGAICNAVVACTVACVIFLRLSKPGLHRPFRIPLVVPVFSLMIQIGIAVLSVYKRPLSSLIGVSIFLSGIPVYYLHRYQVQIDLVHTYTTWGQFKVVLQKLFMVAQSEEDKTI